MRVLVVEERREPRERLLRALDWPGFAVEPVSRADAAAAIEREAPDVLLASWSASDGPDLLHALRIAAGANFFYTVLVVDGETAAKDIPLALAAGAHDFVRTPFAAEELRARLSPTARLAPWAARRPVESNTLKARVGELRAWLYAGQLVAHDLEQLVGAPLQVRETKSLPCGVRRRAATIALSFVQDQSEVMMSVAVDDRAVGRLSALLLGAATADDASVADMLRELANTAGGAFKRAALPENAVVSTGMPTDELVATTPAVGTRFWQLTFDAGAAGESGEPITISVIAAIRARANIQLRADKLQEGMVLVGDVRNRCGMLVVSAGTRLTATSAERLASMLGGALVDIARAA